MPSVEVPSVIPPTGEQIEIAAGDLRAVVVEVGGGLRSYTVAGIDLLDGYGPDEMAPSGRGQVLIPWPNRLADGTYEFDGTRQQLPINEPELGNAIHGLVRWQAGPSPQPEREADRVVVEHTLHPQPGYPFSLALRIEYTLSADGLSVLTSATNAGASACPFGGGPIPGSRSGRHDRSGRRADPGRVVAMWSDRDGSRSARVVWTARTWTSGPAGRSEPRRSTTAGRR